MAASGQTLEKQLQALIKQNKYEAATRKLQQSLKRDPTQTLTTTVADIYLLQGQHEYRQGQYAQAEATVQQALELGLVDDTHYWLAKCLLAQDKKVEALELFQTAFEDKTLPKDMGGCYLKLLFLNGEEDAVENLIETQAKRFYAPQLHWARGAIALQNNKPKDALPHFKKMGKPASPEDSVDAWPLYAYQQADSWLQAEEAISAVWPQFGHRPFSLDRPDQHLAIQALMLCQIAHTQRAPKGFSPARLRDEAKNDLGYVVTVSNFLQANNAHEAAHALAAVPEALTDKYPALKALSRPILLRAGEQAREEGELSCSVEFWEEALQLADEFEPNLALNLYKALNAIGYDDDAYRLLQKVIDWLQREAKQNPQTWPAERLNPTLAVLYCWQSDCQISLGQHRNAERTVQKAHKLAPEHREVVGRQGLVLFVKHDEAAIPMLRQALEAGSEFEEIYIALCQALEPDPAALKAVRQKYGRRFGDTGVETEVDLPDWVEALSFQHYNTMAQFVRARPQAAPPLNALRIFIDAAEDEASSGQKITLNQSQANAQWEKLLAAHTATEQVEIVKAIYLTVQQHGKRNQKGMVALQRSYLNKMAQLLEQQVSGADVGYVMLSAIASPDPKKLEPIVAPVLNRAIQPAQTLARTQLEIRRFEPSRALRFFIEDWRKKEPQNPLLLLASATLHPRDSGQYQTFYDKGFEIARRLQDAEALQAFREEDWFEAQDLTRRVIGSDIDRMNNPSPIDMLNILQRMAREAFGGDVPPDVMARLISEMMGAEMGPGMGGGMFGRMPDMFMDDEVDDDDDFDAAFEAMFNPLPSRRSGRKKSSKKRKF